MEGGGAGTLRGCLTSNQRGRPYGACTTALDEPGGVAAPPELRPDTGAGAAPVPSETGCRRWGWLRVGGAVRLGAYPWDDRLRLFTLGDRSPTTSAARGSTSPACVVLVLSGWPRRYNCAMSRSVRRASYPVVGGRPSTGNRLVSRGWWSCCRRGGRSAGRAARRSARPARVSCRRRRTGRGPAAGRPRGRSPRSLR